MANASNFNTADFLKGAYYAPIKVGKHDVVLTKVKPVFETNDNGEDASYLAVDMKFQNERIVPIRFYGIGSKIALDQIRQQMNDETDYKSINDFLKVLKNANLSVWVSKRTYEAKDGSIKTTLQYDFVEPVSTENEEEVPC